MDSSFSEINGLFVIPCFNEEKRIVLDDWAFLANLFPKIKWIFVNDGSTDGTSDLLMSLTSVANIALISLEKNSGKAEAIRLGLVSSLARYPEVEYFGYLDADSAFSIVDVEKLIYLCLILSGTGNLFAQENKETAEESRLDFTANIQNNHLWRGLIITDKPVVMGNLSYALDKDKKWKVGVWGASALTDDKDNTHYKEINYYHTNYNAFVLFC
jgi:glycosyltransferase involved in cell wall biosynthesis